MRLKCIVCHEEKDILTGLICKACKKRGYGLVQYSNPPRAHKLDSYKEDPTYIVKEEKRKQKYIQENRETYLESQREGAKRYYAYMKYNSYFQAQMFLHNQDLWQKGYRFNKFPISIDVESATGMQNLSFCILQSERRKFTQLNRMYQYTCVE